MDTKQPEGDRPPAMILESVNEMIRKSIAPLKRFGWCDALTCRDTGTNFAHITNYVESIGFGDGHTRVCWVGYRIIR